MELARALTTRRRQGSDVAYMGPARAASTRTAPIKRSAISHPVNLISTTNVLALNAPNIYGSADDSDSSISLGGTSRATTPEMTPSDSPVEPNHLSSYFHSNKSAVRRSKDSIDNHSPAIPTRAMSHTKQAHQVAARKRSGSKSLAPPNAIHHSPPPRTSLDMFSSKPQADHPFGAELAEVNKVAENFSATEVLILDDEERYLMSHGLCKFGAEEYVDEIQGLFGGSYNNPFSPFTPVWI